MWLAVISDIPSLTLLVATFTLTEDDGDLSALLRADYRSEAVNVRLRVPGRLGRVPAKIPWARPGQHAMSYDIRWPDNQKRLACQDLIAKHELACWKWLTGRFAGRFSVEEPTNRPTMRLLFTREYVPFMERHRWLEPVGLAFARQVWHSTDPPGWALSFREWPYRTGRFVATAAARRGDVVQSTSDGEAPDTAWYLTQRFHDQSILVARWAMTCLLSIYADQLAHLRDRPALRRHPGRAIRQSRDLDNYLIGDGLDAATITNDVRVLTDDLNRFRRHLPEYTEDWGEAPPRVREKHEASELAPSLCSWLRRQAERLSEDTKATTPNIRASAELRQTIANTKLQRRILALTLVVTVIAVISFVLAISPDGG